MHRKTLLFVPAAVGTNDGRHAAMPLDALRQRPILLTDALDRPIVITRTAAYDRRVGERTLVETGEAIGGPLKGQRLTRISAKTVYWAISGEIPSRK